MNDELYHYGIKGQKWGVRRYQNEDGSLTEKGKTRYKVRDSSDSSKESKNNAKLARNLAIAGAGIAGAALLTYGGIKLSKNKTIQSQIKAIRKNRERDKKLKKEVKAFRAKSRDMKKYAGSSEYSPADYEDMTKLISKFQAHRDAHNKYYVGVKDNAVQDWVTDVVSGKLGKVAATAIAGGAAYAGKEIVKKKKGETASNYMFPNPNKK